MGSGVWGQGFGAWGFGFGGLGTLLEFWVLGLGFGYLLRFVVLDTRRFLSAVCGLWFMVPGLKVWGSGFRVQVLGLGFRVSGLGLGFMVQTIWLGVQGNAKPPVLDPRSYPLSPIRYPPTPCQP